jgi:hypothetical protein
MKRLIVTFFAVCAAAAVLCGCEDYYPSNAPRETATMRSNVLTTVTTSETTRAETYSEYISSLREMEQSIREEASGQYTLQRETAVTTDPNEKITADTGVTTATADMGQSVPADTGAEAVTTVPRQDLPTDTAVTSVCEPNAQTETPETVTAPPFGIGDIPAVPSESVSAETAVTNYTMP